MPLCEKAPLHAAAARPKGTRTTAINHYYCCVDYCRLLLQGQEGVLERVGTPLLRPVALSDLDRRWPAGVGKDGIHARSYRPPSLLPLHHITSIREGEGEEGKGREEEDEDEDKMKSTRVGPRRDRPFAAVILVYTTRRWSQSRNLTILISPVCYTVVRVWCIVR